MDELLDYDFPYQITIIGSDDFNDKFRKIKSFTISYTYSNSKWLQNSTHCSRKQTK